MSNEQEVKKELPEVFVVFTDGWQDHGVDGMVQLSNRLDSIERAINFCNAWKNKKTYIYKLVNT